MEESGCRDPRSMQYYSKISQRGLHKPGMDRFEIESLAYPSVVRVTHAHNTSRWKPSNSTCHFRTEHSGNSIHGNGQLIAMTMDVGWAVREQRPVSTNCDKTTTEHLVFSVERLQHDNHIFDVAFETITNLNAGGIAGDTRNILGQKKPHRNNRVILHDTLPS